MRHIVAGASHFNFQGGLLGLFATSWLVRRTEGNALLGSTRNILAEGYPVSDVDPRDNDPTHPPIWAGGRSCLLGGLCQKWEPWLMTTPSAKRTTFSDLGLSSGPPGSSAPAWKRPFESWDRLRFKFLLLV